MELLRFIPVRLTLLLVGGILIGKVLDPGLLFSLITVFTAFSCLGISYVQRHSEHSLFFALSFGLCVCSFGILAFTLSQPKNHPTHYSRFLYETPGRLYLRVVDVLRPTDYYARYLVALERLGEKRVSGSILLRIKLSEEADLLQIDDQLIVLGTIETLKPPLNPYQFDYRAYMESLGIYHQVSATEQALYVVGNSPSTLAGEAARIRQVIIERIASSGFGKEELSVFKALLLGQRTDMDPETYDSYKKAGAVHILAVSGLHIGILLCLLHFLLHPLERVPKGRFIKLLLLLLLLWSYAFLAGFSASVTRAVSMFSFVAYALYLNRPANTYNILSLSMFFILLLADASLLFHPGFQMSYAAVISIVWMYPGFQSMWRPRYWLISKAWQLLSVSLAAQLGVLPVSLYYFHQFPALFFISSLLIIPFLGLILGSGFLMVALAYFNKLPLALSAVHELLIKYMNQLVFWVARQEAFVFTDIPFGIAQLSIALVIVIGFGRWLNIPTIRNAIIPLVGILGMQAFNMYQLLDTRAQEKAWLLHHWGNTLLFHQTGPSLDIVSASGEIPPSLLRNFRVHGRVKEIHSAPFQHGYQWKKSKLYTVGRHGGYPPRTRDTMYLLLKNNPRIHLERLIDSVRPNLIIADGSNYTSLTRRWRASCDKMKVPFHSTAEQGAYVFDIK